HEDVEVEVATARAHPADVQRQEGTHQVGAGIDVVTGDQWNVTGDLEVRGTAPRPRPGEALGQRLAVVRVVTWRVEEGKPAVGDLGGERNVAWTLRGEDHGQVGAQGMHRRTQRLAQP